MNILVVNAGSSSLKYQLLNFETREVLAKGAAERIGDESSFLTHKKEGVKEVVEQPLKDHDEAIGLVLDKLVNGANRAVESLEEIDAVGHRIVQGGKYFDRSVIIDDDVIAKIDELCELAPLHNGPALLGIRACMNHMPGVPMVAVFDSAYFQTLAPEAYMYPIPYEYYEKYAIRRYGAHGTSHRYVAGRVAEIVGKPLESLRVITCHLGNGASVSAIKGGVAIDTSMGLTPLDGLMMGTRSGALDPTVVTYIMEHENMTAAEANTMLNKKSGVLGISGVSNDMRSVDEEAQKGNERCELAYKMWAHIVKKTVGGYIAEMGGVDVIAMAAGVGENDAKARMMALSGLEELGIEIDPERNKVRGEEALISTDASRVKVYVIPTEEEYAIARDVYSLVK